MCIIFVLYYFIFLEFIDTQEQLPFKILRGHIDRENIMEKQSQPFFFFLSPFTLSTELVGQKIILRNGIWKTLYCFKNPSVWLNTLQICTALVLA